MKGAREPQAQDVMSTSVATIGAGATVREAARLMAERRVSALPVIDERGRVAGIVSEGDLVRRSELGAAASGSWWLRALTEDTARDYQKSHGTSVRDVMTSPALSVRRATPLPQVARLMEKHRIKRLPVIERGRLVGIVSRADLVRRLATAAAARARESSAGRTLRLRVLDEIGEAAGEVLHFNVTVQEGTVHLWGGAASAAQQKALRAAAKAAKGVRRVEDHTFVVPPRLTGALRAG
jgi:CBS domain-containing protein